MYGAGRVDGPWCDDDVVGRVVCMLLYSGIFDV